MENKKEKSEELPDAKENLSPYEPPRIVTYSEDELLAKLGPAQACSPFGGSVLGC